MALAERVPPYLPSCRRAGNQTVLLGMGAGPAMLGHVRLLDRLPGFRQCANNKCWVFPPLPSSAPMLVVAAASGICPGPLAARCHPVLPPAIPASSSPAPCLPCPLRPCSQYDQQDFVDMWLGRGQYFNLTDAGTYVYDVRPAGRPVFPAECAKHREHTGAAPGCTWLHTRAARTPPAASLRVLAAARAPAMRHACTCCARSGCLTCDPAPAPAPACPRLAPRRRWSLPSSPASCWAAWRCSASSSSSCGCSSAAAAACCAASASGLIQRTMPAPGTSSLPGGAAGRRRRCAYGAGLGARAARHG